MNAKEIRARLSEFAPYQAEGEVTALALARQQAVEGQIAWARLLDPGHEVTIADIALVHGCLATAVLLITLAGVDEALAGKVATQIRDAWEDGGAAGEWLWEIHGSNAKEIADLACMLAAMTERGPDGHVREKASREREREQIARDMVRQSAGDEIIPRHEGDR